MYNSILHISGKKVRKILWMFRFVWPREADPSITWCTRPSHNIRLRSTYPTFMTLSKHTQQLWLFQSTPNSYDSFKAHPTIMTLSKHTQQLWLFQSTSNSYDSFKAHPTVMTLSKHTKTVSGRLSLKVHANLVVRTFKLKFKTSILEILPCDQ